jgi:hypothetical protein
MQIAKVIELQAFDFVGSDFSTETREPPMRAFSRVFTQPGSTAEIDLGFCEGDYGTLNKPYWSFV